MARQDVERIGLISGLEQIKQLQVAVIAPRFYFRDNASVGLQGAGQLGEGGKRAGGMQAVYFFQEAAVYGSLVEWGWHVQRGGKG
jgi:hypothetical protein